ncbi:MAG: hypothetical protein ABI164_10135, partial [Acidobacteriaceae bacterium]
MKLFFLPVASGLLVLLCGCAAKQPGVYSGPTARATAPTLRQSSPAESKAEPHSVSSLHEGNDSQQDQALI